MSDINDGGPAFPAHWNGLQAAQHGMTLRDWFAGQALMGLLPSKGVVGFPTAYAQVAYEYADAMLAAREVKP